MSEYIVCPYCHNPLSQSEYVKVVRCRDCKHFTPKGTHKFENGKVNDDYCDYVRGWMLQITPDGFCAWGECETNNKTGDFVTHDSRTKRTCRQEERGWGTEGDHARVWLTCGHDCMVPTVQDLPNYCPECGAKVVG